MKNSYIKKILATAMAGLMSFALIGCGAKAEGDKLDEIKERGTLVVGLSADYAPYEFHIMENGEDKIVGFDVDIAKEIAKDLGVELEIKDMKFDTLISALPNNKVDLVISGMSPDEERKKAVDFSDIYYTAEHGAIVRAKDVEKYKSFADLNGKKVGAQMGSIQADLATETIENVEMQLLSNVNDLVVSLKGEKIEALVCELPVAEMIVKNNPELAIINETIKDEAGGSAIALKKNSPKLLEEVNKTIKRIQDEGLLDQFIVDANKLAESISE
ncbi:MAG: transporter substrate-binding domain-containing protein [Clostridiales bacterium]|uniref:Amino acid ABC transporter n=1 Tax=Clostridium isatidis TaxID=182773 RepID=A0A343J9Y5_9CLOT|nr:transporter substrate-binding domain-containing protein [Clostridium isatidis]ASW42343.1 amino acid ABC transporter [Clostridium isatidis]NLZ49191.1 transporter substrate-binding domain-containing protein [Clostridiales bacterium]